MGHFIMEYCYNLSGMCNVAHSIALFGAISINVIKDCYWKGLELSHLCSGEDNCLKDVLNVVDGKFILYVIAGVARNYLAKIISCDYGIIACEV